MNRDDTGVAPPEGTHESIWLATTEGTDFAPLDGTMDVDLAVVGGGIVGITAAMSAAEAGRSVAVIERDRIVAGVTGHTTAKLTSQHGLIYDHLLSNVGEREAHQYARANQSAIDAVEATIREYDVDCYFERTPAYTYTTDPGKRGRIRTEASAASRLGLPATLVESTSLPYEVEAAVRFDDQAQFHPRKYLLALAREVDGGGNHVFEETTVTGVDEGDPCTVETDRGTITAEDVVIATHFPIVDPALFFARLSPKRSYVVAARLAGDVPEGLYYDPGDPYFSVRPHPTDDESIALFGGQNHRTGHGGSTEERYRRLERRVRAGFDVEAFEYRWSTQDYVSVDRVPLVGRPTPGTAHCYVATGFGGWGMTNGVAAGRLLADLVLGRDSPWREVFSPTRLQIGASAKRFLHHNGHAMRHLVSDVVRRPPRIDLRDLDRNEGRVVSIDGRPVGVHRDGDGDLRGVSARCTHMGCHVEWNDGERSWDCPCHGSRFDADGTVLDTPAIDDLEAVDLPRTVSIPVDTSGPAVETEEDGRE